MKLEIQTALKCVFWLSSASSQDLFRWEAGGEWWEFSLPACGLRGSQDGAGDGGVELGMDFTYLLEKARL